MDAVLGRAGHDGGASGGGGGRGQAGQGSDSSLNGATKEIDLPKVEAKFLRVNNNKMQSIEVIECRVDIEVSNCVSSSRRTL